MYSVVKAQDNQMKRIKVGLDGYGVIGMRVADAICRQRDLALVGIVDVTNDVVDHSHAVVA